MPLITTFASHLLGGSYLLSNLLIPQLNAAAEEIPGSARVIFVTSGGMLLTKFPSWELATSTATNVKYDGVMAYSYAKRGQVLLAEEYAKQYPKISWISGHPGWTATAAVDDAFGDQKKYLEPMRTVWQGAEGLAWLMGSHNLVNGAFYLDRKVQKKHVSGPFMTEGSFTKNSRKEIDEMMENLKKTSDS